MLEAHGKTLFKHSVSSFEKYFDVECFLFIALDVFDVKTFIQLQCKELGIVNYQIIILSKATRGQAETVYLGVKQADVNSNEALLIFNIDTIRPCFTWPTEFDINTIDGYLETFIGSGTNWSNVLPSDQRLQTVKLTAEKQEISQYCCTGLYFWRRCEDYCRVFEHYQQKPLSEVQAGEYYIAPMYNYLIQNNKDIRYSVINENEVIFCGVPEEYHLFLNSNDLV